MVEGADSGRADMPIHFAAACFHFTLRKSGPFSISNRDYCNLVKEALEGVPTVNNVDVKLLDDFGNQITRAEMGSLDEVPQFFPLVLYFRATFDVYIPFRLQHEYANWSTKPPDTTTENFRVYLTHEYNCPVAIVRPLNPTANCDPADAVIVVREHLKAELNKPQSQITFESLGPSPFHANFVLQPDSSSELDTYLCVEMARPGGYADIYLSYNTECFVEIEEAFLLVRHDLTAELDAFYDIRRSISDSYEAWQEIGDHLFAATKKLERTRDRLKRLWRRGAQLSELHESLTRFEAIWLSSNTQLIEDVRKTYDRDGVFVIKEIVENEMHDRPTFPTEQVARLITFMEGRRSQAVELLVVMVAAVIGGVAGALITLAVGGGG